jgi:hypothetical protein
MISRFFLGFQALLFIPYGLYCLVNPGMLAGAAGVAANSTTGQIELQAMYGGLQTAVGVLCALAVFNAAYRRPTMLVLAFLFAGLAVTRVSLGLVHADFSQYTLFAMIFESGSLLMLVWLLGRPDPQAA